MKNIISSTTNNFIYIKQASSMQPDAQNNHALQANLAIDAPCLD